MKRNQLASLLVILLLIICAFNICSSTVLNKPKNESSTVKVLIYDGDGTGKGSVNGIKKGLNDSNNLNLVPNTYFNYSTSQIINSNTLQGYDVLIMPGGIALTYIHNTNINSDSIKQFINQGKGYIGICAGAYAASNHVDNYYTGWGILPDVNTKNVNYEGTISLKTTSYGKNIIKTPLNKIHMENGPAIYSNNPQNVMAEYADNKTGYQNFAAIIGESCGNGRVILSGPHPEIEAKNPQTLIYMILWASSRI